MPYKLRTNFDYKCYICNAIQISITHWYLYTRIDKFQHGTSCIQSYKSHTAKMEYTVASTIAL